MKIDNDKIIQATEDELYSYWLSRGWDDIYPFPEYMQRMKDAGCEVVVEILPTLFERITESPEVLAPKLVYRSFIRRKEIRGNGLFLEIVPIKIKCYKSKVIPGVHYKNSTEAIAATVARLKEVCDEVSKDS